MSETNLNNGYKHKQHLNSIVYRQTKQGSDFDVNQAVFNDCIGF